MPSLRTHISRFRKKAFLKLLKTSDALSGGDLAERKRLEWNGYHKTNYSFRKDQIAFIHLPKTAGTSLSKILQSDSLDRFVNSSVHRPISIHCPPAEFKYVTIMRNPVDRVWSQYQMILRMDDGYSYKKFAKDGLQHFLEKSWLVKDMLCQYLTGKIYGKMGEDDLKLAIENLNQISWVLDFDRFPEECASLCGELDIPLGNVPFELKANYPPPSEQEKSLIESDNIMDIAIFNHWKNNKANA